VIEFLKITVGMFQLALFLALIGYIGHRHNAKKVNRVLVIDGVTHEIKTLAQVMDEEDKPAPAASNVVSIRSKVDKPEPKPEWMSSDDDVPF
jgi:hypothetical protein